MIIDAAFYMLLLLAIYKGFTRGLIVGLFSFFAYIAGLAAALKLSVLVTNYFSGPDEHPSRWLPFISFLLVFVVVVLLVNITARVIRKSLSLMTLGWLDKLGGILLFGTVYTIIFSVFLFYVGKTSLLTQSTIVNSSVYGFVAPWGPISLNYVGKIIPLFKGLFTELSGVFEKIGEQFAD